MICAQSITPTPSTPSPTSSVVPTLAPECIAIQDVQSDGPSSPFLGQNVVICGAFVTRIVGNGFFVQEIITGATTQSNASSGIFVFDTSSFKATLQEGNQLNILAEVKEFFGETQLAMDTATVITGGNHTFDPIVVKLPVTNIDELEQYEGMVISVQPDINHTLVVSEYYNFDRYGEVVVCSADEAIGRLYQFTETNVPDPATYGSYQASVTASCITIDDNSSTQNPNPPLFGSIYRLNSTNFLRGGSEVTTLIGPLWYSFGKWRVATLDEADLSYNSKPREAAPGINADVTISSSNLLNYFVYTGNNPRGANSAEEFSRQVQKAVLALTQMNTDIVGVQEIGNMPGNEAAFDLRDRINSSFPSRNYTFASIEAGLDRIGSDDIKVDVMFDQNKFTFLNSSILFDDMIDADLLNNSTGGSLFDSSRVPLAVTLEVVGGNNEVLTIVVNHFKSKGCRNSIGLDEDKNDGAGCWNWKRTLSSRALLAWLSSNP